MESIWTKTVQIPERKRAEGSLEREIAVIGAGMTGILTAYRLQQMGKQVVVLEADRIAGGQTKNTTAKITSQHGCFYQKLISDIGIKNARLYARANQEAIDAYEKMAAELGAACDFVRLPSYLYSTGNEECLKKEAAAAVSVGIDAEFVKETELPFPVAGAVRFSKQAQFHPLKFISAAAEGLEIYENTPVKRVRKNVIYFDGGTVTAQKIIVATHYPIINFPGMYFMRQHQERSYVLALSQCPKLQGMYYSADPDGLSFRSAQNLLLFGGNSHRTGKKVQGGAYNDLRESAKKYFPKNREVCCWSAQDCMPHDGVPFVGKYYYGQRNRFVATGYQKWGMTSSMAASLLLSDLASGRQSIYEKVFTPQRRRVKAAAGSLMQDMAESVKGLAQGWIFPYSKSEGDEQKHWTRCSHMGCRLKWNPDEQTFDCPCHGSRFTADGELLDEPATCCLKKRQVGNRK